MVIDWSLIRGIFQHHAQWSWDSIWIRNHLNPKSVPKWMNERSVVFLSYIWDRPALNRWQYWASKLFSLETSIHKLVRISHWEANMHFISAANSFSSLSISHWHQSAKAKRLSAQGLNLCISAAHNLKLFSIQSSLRSWFNCFAFNQKVKCVLSDPLFQYPFIRVLLPASVNISHLSPKLEASKTGQRYLSEPFMTTACNLYNRATATTPSITSLASDCRLWRLSRVSLLTLTRFDGYIILVCFEFLSRCKHHHGPLPSLFICHIAELCTQAQYVFLSVLIIYYTFSLKWTQAQLLRNKDDIA